MPQTPQANILVIDDDKASLELLVDTLSVHGYTVCPAQDAHSGLKLAKSQPFDLFMIDVMMPVMSGYDLCALIKEDHALRSIPVIFVSAVGDTQVKVNGFKAGAVDYVTKPYHRDELLARVRTHIDLRQQQIEIERLKQAEVEHLRQVSQLKDEVLRMVAHDIKNPLSIIVGYMQLIQINDEDYLASHGQTAEYLKIMRRNADKILNMVKDLLDLARFENRVELKRMNVSLLTVLQRSVEDQVLPAREKNIRLNYHPPKQDVPIMVSPERFSQAMQNLIGNAIKYTPLGGQVDVSADVLTDEVVFQVRDNGIGIPKEDLVHLFDKFYRVNTPEHRKRSGSGLGLAIVKALIEQHGGRVWAESELGKGSIFYISLPREM